tara:strand:- start:1550 stop:1945 length:396 start_codon:yes stop_codon:yes gene_type:complete
LNKINLPFIKQNTMFLSQYFKKQKDKKELKNSNFGRNYGWDIEYQGEVIGELTNWKFFDMYWCTYKIFAINASMESILFDEKLWNDCKFKFKNKKYGIYAKAPISSFISGNLLNTKTIRMRMLYLTEQQLY